jgi:O-antigen ligase
MKLPLWFRLPFFADALLVLSFGLKLICPIDNGCFTDPMVQFFFWPLLFAEQRNWFSFSTKQEIIFLLIFWFITASLLGAIIDMFRKPKVEDEVS